VTGFTLHLADATRSERIEGVTSFVGVDHSGSFGIRPRHRRLVTCLVFGLARFRTGEAPWQYLAVPGAVLRFCGDQLDVSTRRYLVDTDLERISAGLEDVLLAEEAELAALKESLRRMEEAMLKRLWQLKRGGEGTLP
jgi:F-type H+-transporting ATPase subunit epsilon